MVKGGSVLYLVSLYFDKQTDYILSNLMKQIARKSGNSYMLERQIPPHLTIGMVRQGKETDLLQHLDRCVKHWNRTEIAIVSIGCFKPHVLFLATVLNRALHEMCVDVNKAFTEEQSRYQPFHWLPHITMARTLNEPQMQQAFHVLQANFNPLKGTITEVGLSTGNPYQDIKRWKL